MQQKTLLRLQVAFEDAILRLLRFEKNPRRRLELGEKVTTCGNHSVSVDAGLSIRCRHGCLDPWIVNRGGCSVVHVFAIHVTRYVIRSRIIAIR